MEFRFSNPLAFQLLWLIPIVLGLGYYFIKNNRAKLQAVVSGHLLPFLTSSVSTRKRRWKLILECLALLFFVVALARPQTGESRQKIKSEGIELMLLVDVSRSMLAEDVKPSRLELAKKELSRLVDSGSGDRVGIIAFAGSGILLSPVTSDKSALKMYIESLSPDSVSTQGTVFKGALEEARDAFKRGGVDETETSLVTRAIVIASDGEDNEEGAIEMAKLLKEEGISIFSLAFGTEKGGPIPIRDSRGQLRGYQKDNSGKVVLTQTKGTILKSLAETGEGSFYHVTYGSLVVNNLRKDLNRLQKSEFDSADVVNYGEDYQLWLFIGIVFALIELLLGERSEAGRIWRGRFEVAAK